MSVPAYRVPGFWVISNINHIEGVITFEPAVPGYPFPRMSYTKKRCIHPDCRRKGWCHSPNGRLCVRHYHESVSVDQLTRIVDRLETLLNG